MPLLNEKHWIDRFGISSPAKSGEYWLDWEHGAVMRRAYRRILSKNGARYWNVILDVGCGDGEFSRWMFREFDAPVIGIDALESPGVRRNIAFIQWDPERLDALSEAQLVAATDFAPCDSPRMFSTIGPKLVVFSNSLTCLKNWKAAVAAACRSANTVMAFDNFSDDAKEYWKDLDYRSAITAAELRYEFALNGFALKDSVAADYFHRKLFLVFPQRWLAPVVAAVSASLDYAAAYQLTADEARHSCFLFERRR